MEEHHSWKRIRTREENETTGASLIYFIFPRYILGFERLLHFVSKTLVFVSFFLENTEEFSVLQVRVSNLSFMTLPGNVIFFFCGAFSVIFNYQRRFSGKSCYMCRMKETQHESISVTLGVTNHSRTKHIFVGWIACLLKCLNRSFFIIILCYST